MVRRSNIVINRIKYLFKASLVIAMISATALIPHKFESADNEHVKDTVAEQQMYDALVTKGLSSVTVTSSEDAEQLFADLIEDDREDTLYDGASILARGYGLKTTVSGNTYTYTIVDAYDIADADYITDQMAEKAKGIAGEGASTRELAYAVIEVISDTYDYNNENSNEIEADSETVVDNFTKVYYDENPQTTCSSFAAMTYLVMNKVGVETEYVHGADHIYNAVKLNGKDYTLVDTSCDIRYLNLVNQIQAYVGDGYSLNATDSIDKAVNSGLEYRYATLFDVILNYWFYISRMKSEPEIAIGIIMLLILVKYLFPRRTNYRKNVNEDGIRTKRRNLV